jgi:hypothetical protein
VKKAPYPPPGGPAVQRRDPFETLGPSANRQPANPASMRQPASPYDGKLNLAATAWMSELPQQVAPLTLAHQFPRIVNRLARFWDSPQMIDQYLEQLLVDRRGRRKGFPEKALEELYALAEFHRRRHKSSASDLWESIPYRRQRGR